MKIYDKKRKILLFVITLVAAVMLFGAGAVLGAGTAEPGSQGDPLITMSYLEKRLSELGVGGYGLNSANAGNQTETTNAGFTRMTLEKGQSIILSDGSELVIYSGSGTVLGTSGLISLTGGEVFPAGTTAVLYTDYLAVGGKSGVKAQSTMTVYVRGTGNIE